MKKIGGIIGTALGFVGAGMMMAAGSRLEGYLHDKVMEFKETHEVSIKKKKVGPYDVK